MENKIKTMVADDHSLIKTGIEKVLAGESNLEVLQADTSTGELAFKAIKELAPELLFLDINFPDTSGITMLPKIKKMLPKTKIIMLSFHDEAEYIKKSMNAGADGYLSKSASIEMIMSAIDIVFTGNQYIQPTIANALFLEPKMELKPKMDKIEISSADPSILTAKEIEVVKLMLGGEVSSKEIGEKLNITEKTARNHVYNIKKKLKASSRLQVILWAMEKNIDFM